MKLFSLLSIFFLLSLGNSYAQQIKSEFVVESGETKVKEGDVFEGTLRFWPIENAELDQFKKLEKTALFNALYLERISSLGTSVNNSDVVELKGLFIVKGAQASPTFNVPYKNSLIEVRLDHLSIQKLENAHKEFYLLSQSLPASKNWIFLVLGLGGLLLLCVLGRKKISGYFTRFKKRELYSKKKRYSTLFREAKTREDFERLYLEREEWLSLLDNKAPAHFGFLKTLDQHQYKKDWGQEEREDVQNSFEVIRGSFEK